jgi:hypothetical protein
MSCQSKHGYGCEPSLAEVLDDPLVQAVMARDGVERSEIEDLAQSVRRASWADEED